MKKALINELWYKGEKEEYKKATLFLTALWNDGIIFSIALHFYISLLGLN